MCSLLRDMDFVGGFVSFRIKLCGVQSSPVRFARKMCVARGTGRDQLFWSKLSAKVGQRDSYRSYSQVNDEGVQMVPRPKPLSVR